jgi:hypothetical protein
LVAFTVDLLDITFYVDGEADTESTPILPSKVVDLMTNTHILGQSFEGFLYQFCARNRVNSSFEYERDSCGSGDFCTICPIANCLYNCDIDMAIDNDNTCTTCKDECLDSGCIRETDCRTCTDDYCEDCPEKYSECLSDGCI